MSEDVIEFGSEPARSWDGSTRAWRGDRRISWAAAGLAAVAGIASLLGEWQSITEKAAPGNNGQTTHLLAPLISLGSFGTAYMVALILLVTAVVLVLFGQSPVRHTARIAGLAVTGATLALLAMAAYSLSRSGMNSQFYLGLPEEYVSTLTFKVERGLWSGVAAVVLCGLALFVAPTGADQAPPTSEVDTEPDDHVRDSGPMGLTVSSTSPFARPE